MECPACLICAEALQPWAVLQSTSPIKESKPKRTKRKVRKGCLEMSMQGGGILKFEKSDMSLHFLHLWSTSIGQKGF